ncbi:MAG: hypothetical protein Q9174_002179 [Haloplaca sp. 1 TL-2023]
MRSSTDLSGTHPSKDPGPITSPSTPSHSAPTSLYLTNQDPLLRSKNQPDRPPSDSNYGITSVPEPADEAGQRHESQGSTIQDVEDMNARRRSTLKPAAVSQSPSPETTYGRWFGAGSPPLNLPRVSSAIPSVSSDSQMANQSLPSSPKSTSSRSARPSDRESVYDGVSQALTSSDEEAEILPVQGVVEDAPQLIMPSIQMPSRRPFTERGKNLGRLKILLAGDSGLGKTSLIKSIVQICDDIVHVDPISTTSSSVDSSRNCVIGDNLPKDSSFSTTKVKEIWASTKAFPHWWTELDQNEGLHGRKGAEEPVLERNLCFVDTPGYSRGLSMNEDIQDVVSYIEAQLPRSLTATASTHKDLIRMLSGHGGSQVHLVLYLFGHEIRPADIDYVYQLSQITNVIPLIARADTLEPADLEDLKSSISDELNLMSIPTFSLDPSDSHRPPYSVTSHPSKDLENMDASLLMSSEYIQPLLPSELGFLIDHLFDADNLARLRHLSAKKLVQSTWTLGSIRRNITNTSDDVKGSEPMFSTLESGSSTLGPKRNLFHSRSPSRGSHSLTNRLYTWAKDSEESEASLADEKSLTLPRLVDFNTFRFGPDQTNDPLGLLRQDEIFHLRGYRMLQLVSAFGLFGAAAVWVARKCSLSSLFDRGRGCSDWPEAWVNSQPWTA